MLPFCYVLIKFFGDIFGNIPRVYIQRETLLMCIQVTAVSVNSLSLEQIKSKEKEMGLRIIAIC